MSDGTAARGRRHHQRWDSVTANRQLELVEPIEKGLVKRKTVQERGATGTKRSSGAIPAGSSTTRTIPDLRVGLPIVKDHKNAVRWIACARRWANFSRQAA
jgi:hypothetical protein